MIVEVRREVVDPLTVAGGPALLPPPATISQNFFLVEVRVDPLPEVSHESKSKRAFTVAALPTPPKGIGMYGTTANPPPTSAETDATTLTKSPA